MYLGPSCTGAVLVSLSATKGATLFRVKRNDEFIFQMMTWIQKFHKKYILNNSKIIPTENYFLKDQGYLEFLDLTMKICAESKIIANIDNSDIQRSPLNGNFFI